MEQGESSSEDLPSRSPTPKTRQQHTSIVNNYLQQMAKALSVALKTHKHFRQ